MHRIFYHRMDHDGKLAGAIARKYFEEKGEPFYLYPFNYDDKLPVEDFDQRDKIYFLDVSTTPYKEIEVLLDMGFDVTICDHHKSFIETGIPARAKGLSYIEDAGCILTWKYFYPGIEVPRFVNLIGKYDIWDKNNELWQTEILPFQWGMRNKNTDVINHFSTWKDLFDHDSIDDIIEEGRLILEFQKKSYSGALHSHGFEATLEDYPDLRLICLNSPGGNSMMFEDKWDPSHHDAMFAFVYNGQINKFICSLYTLKDLDLSVVAKNYGGGGHAQACGFSTSKLEFDRGIIKISSSCCESS